MVNKKNSKMIHWIKKLFGIRRPERITEEQIGRLPADKLCRKYIDGELVGDMESEVFDGIMCAVELHAEVVNGGFNQYYYNSGGERAERAGEPFAKLGATRIAELVKRANGRYAACREELQSRWDGTKEGFAHGYKEKIFDAFDGEYYALMKGDRQLYTLIGTYIKQHPQEFLTDKP